MSAATQLKLREKRLECALEGARLRFMGAKTPFARRFAFDILERIRERLLKVREELRG
jgi:hypothetical protein